MKAMYSVSTNEYFLKNPQLGNIPTRSTIAAWSSLLMLLNANPPCLLRGQSKYFGKCQDAVECHAYMPMARHSAICYIPHTNVYPCIPMYTNVYSVISRIPHNYWPECQQGHCLHPLLVWQWFHANVYWTHAYILGRVENSKTFQNQMAQCFFIGLYDIETGDDFYFFQKKFFDRWKWIFKKSSAIFCGPKTGIFAKSAHLWDPKNGKKNFGKNKNHPQFLYHINQ